MDADDKENVVGFDLCSYVHSNMENGDQNKSKCADVSTAQEGMLQPVDLTTDKIAVVDGGQDKERWIKEPLACRENSDEEEVFFGDVTNKELKKTKKFNSRKTAVFVPGFRRDRRLMRYTMVPSALSTVGENEETTANTGARKERSLGQDSNGGTASEVEHSQSVQLDEGEVGTNPPEDQAADPEGSAESEKTAPLAEKDTEPIANTPAADAVITSVESTSAESCGKEVACITTSSSSLQGAGIDGGSAESCGKEVACITTSSSSLQVAATDGGSAEMENLITKVINESLHEVDEEPDCSLLLPAGPNEGSSSSGPGSSEDDNSEEEMSNQEIVENMMRVLDKRTAFLAALAKMRQRPDNNPNTKGKPESFERLLKESEDRQTPKSTEITDVGDIPREQHGANEGKEDLSETDPESACAHLESEFQKLQVESDGAKGAVENTSQSFVNSSPSDRFKLKSESTDEVSHSMNQLDSGSILEAHDGLASVVTKDLDESSTERLKVDSDNENTEGPVNFLNRNNSNSVESEVSLDQVANAISELTLDSLPQQEILPNLTDDKAFAIDTIVARAADNKELVDILPELDVDDIIDLLAESSAADLFTPQRDVASAGLGADSNLISRRIDNTMVVASNNRIASPSMMYPTLPEISSRIGATHTVTSVRGPISSPGAVRSEKRYRSIYATLPTDSIQIETQVVPARNLDTDLLASFGKLDIEEEPSSQCPLDDPLLTGTQMVLPVQSDSPFTIAANATDNLDINFCSPVPQSPKFQGSSPPAVQNMGSPLLSTRDRAIVGRPHELCVNQGHSPETTTFSPSVVFTEKNFSPLLEVHFPPSPPIEIPAGLQKCTVHSSVSPKPSLCSSHPASREMKRKQPSGEESACREAAPTSGQKRDAPVKITPTKARVPRTPPKKVIGQPNVHKFHTAFGRNPASRSLAHKFSIHVSPKTVSKTAPKTPASNPKTRAKSPNSARKLMLSKPPVSSRTPNNKAPTPGSTSRGANSLTKTPGSVNKKVPSDLNTGTPAKDKTTSSSVGSAQRLSSKKSKGNADRTTPMKPLFTRPSPLGRVHGTPLRQAVTPKTPASQERTYTQLGKRPPHGKPRGTPLRVIDGEVTSSPVFTSSSPSRVTMRRRGGSGRTPNHNAGDSATKGAQCTIPGEDPVYGVAGVAQSPMTDKGEKPVIFTKGTPRYTEGEHGDVQFDIYSEEPPVFDLSDIQEDLPNGSRESSPRLSMEDVLERKRQQMMNLRAEKRKIEDIISKQGSPTIKSPRANNTISYDTLPKQRFSNTQTLALSDKELEAVTQLHTLCNSQRTVKVLHKGRAMLIRQVPQSPHAPRRLSWNKDIEVEIDETDSPTDGESSPLSTEATSPPKPILSKKDARFVYPFDDESPSPVVVFRSRNGGERPRSTRSPRID